MLTWLLLLVALADDVVTVDVATWRALQPPLPPAEITAPDSVLDRRVQVAQRVGHWQIDATWVVRSEDPRDLRLVGPDAIVRALTIDDRPASGAALADGTHLLAPPGTRTIRLTAEVLAARDGGATLDLLPAVRGELVLPPGFEASGDGPLAVLSDVVVTGAGRLVLTPSRHEVVDARAVVAARVAIGITVDDGQLDVHARASWLPRRHRLDVVRFDAPGAGADLRVTGVQVEHVARDGDRVTVRLHRPSDRVDLDVRWSAPLPSGDRAVLPLPRLVPLEVGHVERATSLARASELQLVPEVGGGVPVLPETLPPWAAGLVTGESAAAWTGDAAGTVDVLRYVPVEQPPVMIDRADLLVATSPEGRALIAVTLSVRNERGASLRLVPPPGHTLTAVAVDGVPVPAAPDGDGWRIAIPRSVETVQGLLSFPVEATMIGIGGPRWARHVDAELALPRFDAPVAVRRVTLDLPRGWRPRADVGHDGVVDGFAEGEGLSYGFGVADEAEATRLYQQALQSWMENDFSTADASLRQLEAIGATNSNVVKLRANVDVVQGKQVEADETIVRRIREQAQARASDDYRAQEDALRAAKKAEASGDEQAAAEAYDKVADYAEKLGALEQEESVRQASYQQVARSRLAVIEEKKQAAKPDAPVAPSPFEALVRGEAQLDAAAGDAGLGGLGFVGGGVGGGGQGFGWQDGDATPSPEPAPEPPPPPAIMAPPQEEAAQADRRIIDTESTTIGHVVSKDYLRKIPTGRSYTEAVTSTASRSAGAKRASRGPVGLRVPGAARPRPEDAGVLFEVSTVPLGGEVTGTFEGVTSGVAAGASVVDAPVAGDVLDAESPDALEPLDVTATGIAAVVPVVGETVRFQHLLLDPDDDVRVHVVADQTRRTR